MFILCKGKVSIRNESGDEIAQLHKGQFFGEFALIYEARRSATVKSVGVTEVSVLNHVVGYGGGRCAVLRRCIVVVLTVKVDDKILVSDLSERR